MVTPISSKKNNSKETDYLSIKSNIIPLSTMIKMLNKSKYTPFKSVDKYSWSDINKIQDITKFKENKSINIMALSSILTYNQDNKFISKFKGSIVPTIPYICN